MAVLAVVVLAGCGSSGEATKPTSTTTTVRTTTTRARPTTTVDRLREQAQSCTDRNCYEVVVKQDLMSSPSSVDECQARHAVQRMTDADLESYAVGVIGKGDPRGDSLINAVSQALLDAAHDCFDEGA